MSKLVTTLDEIQDIAYRKFLYIANATKYYKDLNSLTKQGLECAVYEAVLEVYKTMGGKL